MQVSPAVLAAIPPLVASFPTNSTGVPLLPDAAVPERVARVSGVGDGGLEMRTEGVQLEAAGLAAVEVPMGVGAADLAGVVVEGVVGAVEDERVLRVHEEGDRLWARGARLVDANLALQAPVPRAVAGALAAVACEHDSVPPRDERVGMVAIVYLLRSPPLLRLLIRVRRDIGIPRSAEAPGVNLGGATSSTHVRPAVFLLTALLTTDRTRMTRRLGPVRLEGEWMGRVRGVGQGVGEHGAERVELEAAGLAAVEVAVDFQTAGLAGVGGQRVVRPLEGELVLRVEEEVVEGVRASDAGLVQGCLAALVLALVPPPEAVHLTEVAGVVDGGFYQGQRMRVAAPGGELLGGIH